MKSSIFNVVSGYWTNFIKTGNPNSKGLPGWPVFNTKNNISMILNEKPEAKPLPGKEGLDFLISETGK